MDKNMKQNLSEISKILYLDNICCYITFLTTINSIDFSYNKHMITLILRKGKYCNDKWSKYTFRELAKRDITFKRIDSFKNFIMRYISK